MNKVPFCSKCGLELPENSNFCPKCGTSIATVTTQPQSEGRVLSREKTCPKCDTVMRIGFMVERDSPLSFWTLGEGIYWAPSETGIMEKRVAVKAYVCPRCGYIEQYVRRLESDRNIILRAPTTTQE